MKMTAIENYSNLIDSIFGHGTTSFDCTKDVYNHIIGALNNPSEFWEFKTNFTERLKRLKTIYSLHPSKIKEIIVQVNEIASEKNWEGAFAELATFDHFNHDILGHKTYLYKPIKPNVTIDKRKTFALELGKSAANLDGYIEDISLYFDVKCFKDNVTEILNGIYKELEIHFSRNDFNIEAEHALDISYDDIKAERNNLLAELKTKISPTDKTKYVSSTIISHLVFRIHWGAGIKKKKKTYHPFRHAENYYKMIFNYANKFVKDKPTLIVLVTFPWYNNIVSDFGGGNVKLYRALSRRFFCQYKYDNTLFNSFNSSFSDSQTIYEVSNNLSGIIFLEDVSILSKEPNKTNVKSYVYLNPNAINPLKKSLAIDFILGLHNTEFDDFEYDNY